MSVGIPWGFILVPSQTQEPESPCVMWRSPRQVPPHPRSQYDPLPADGAGHTSPVRDTRIGRGHEIQRTRTAALSQARPEGPLQTPTQKSRLCFPEGGGRTCRSDVGSPPADLVSPTGRLPRALDPPSSITAFIPVTKRSSKHPFGEGIVWKKVAQGKSRAP